MSTFYEEIADAVMETPAFKKTTSTIGSMVLTDREHLRKALGAAAKMGAEGVNSLVEEHDVKMGWSCKVCGLPIVARDIDENHTVWEHAHD